ncbi:MAG: hypothetical protein RJA57_451 [Bacteroidota bacterium]|jgi:hypothetical protein
MNLKLPIMKRLTVLLPLIVVIAISFLSNGALAQNEPTSAEIPEKITPTLSVTMVQRGDGSIDLRAGLTARANKQVMNLYRMKLTFYRTGADPEVLLGTAITRSNGKALLNVKADSLLTDEEGNLTVKAVFSGNNLFEGTEESITARRARITLEAVKADSIMTLNLRVTGRSGAAEVPVAETMAGIYVKRLFGMQKLGEVTTDENGEGSLDIPQGLPGDPKGTITLVARIDENDPYGNLEEAVVRTWGIPVSDQLQDQPRALWSSHPPLWMLITFIVLMAAVWGHYLVILYELFRLRKEPTASVK